MLSRRSLRAAAAAFFLAAIWAGQAQAQNALLAGGVFFNGHLVMTLGGRALDAGGPGIANGPPLNSVLPGTLPTGLGIVNGGQGLALFSAYAKGPYSEFRMGFDGSGNALITVDGINGNTPGCNINLNGTLFPCVGSGAGNMLAPTSPVPVGGQLVEWAANGSPATKNGGLPPLMASAFAGFDRSGVADSTSAINACLTAAGAGGSCMIDRGATVKLAGIAAIPAYTTLACDGTRTLPDETGGAAALTTLPSVRIVAATGSVQAAGEGATFRGCLVLPSGMSFPQTDDSGWIGTPISSNGNNIFTVDDTVVAGFDTCVNGYGTSRLRVRRLMYDCKGASLAAFYAGNNTDAGELKDIKGQPVATGNGCSAAFFRHGIGFELNNDGGELVDNIVVQNWTVGQFLLNNSNAFLGERVWADGPGASCLGFAGYGLKIATGNDISIQHYDANGTGGPALIVTQGIFSNNTVSIGDVFFNGVGGDCLQTGGPGLVGGVISIGRFNTSPTGCAGYALNNLDVTTGTTVRIGHAYVQHVHGQAAPYFLGANSNSRYGQGKLLYIDALDHDLGAGNPFAGSGILFSAGSRNINTILTPTLGACTGLGSGSCALFGGSNAAFGLVTLSPAGSPSTTGAVPITMPQPAGIGAICAVNLQSGTASWNTSSAVVMASVDTSHFQLQWNNNGGALTAGSTYQLTYSCDQF